METNWTSWIGPVTSDQTLLDLNQNTQANPILAMVWNKGKNIEGTIVMGHNLFCPPLQHNGS